MNIRKKKSIISLFVAGTLLFSSVALADVIIGDGYSSAKQALKYTSKTLAHNTDSFSANVNYEFKCDGTIVENGSNYIKFDVKNQRQEEIGTTGNKIHGDTSNYRYIDSQKNIHKGNDDEKYYQYNYSNPDEQYIELEDPFDEDIAADIEKVADAFVSNMKDFVQVKDSENNGKLYYGSLDSSQIPSFANALASLGAKYSLFEQYNRKRMGIPEIKDNIYFKEVSGKVSQNSDGLLDSLVGTAVILGNDEQGTEHIFTISVSFSLYDVNSTVVNEPTIDSENIIVSQSKQTKIEFTSMDIMTYKSNIISVQNDMYSKSGERTLTINSVDDDTVNAHLTIIGTTNDIDTDIIAKRTLDSDEYIFEYADKNGTKQGMLRKGEYNIVVSLDGSIDTENNYFVYSDDDDNNFCLEMCF